MKKRGITCLITFIAVCIALTAGLVQAGPLSDADKQFLARYEKVRSALAADDLGAAKTTAGDLGEEGAPLAKSSSLKDARAAFEKLSDKAKQLAAGQPGFYVVHCPMLQKDWVQTSEKIANPYYGKEMPACGEIKK
jgi:Cu(I)/Ag(I) efflux system membrane fusion protein